MPPADRGATSPVDAGSRSDEPTVRKRARGALSCAECRRLKLKCDREVPCSNCKRRGCASICPNGSLVTGHGTRFVLADTDRLHRKISDMSERIRQLEDALQTSAPTSSSSDGHPLLADELLKIKSTIDLHTARGTAQHLASDHDPFLPKKEPMNGDVSGGLSLKDYSMYEPSPFCSSAPVPSALAHVDQKPPTNGADLHPTSLPAEITRLSEHDFATPSHSVSDAHASLRGYLPPWQQAQRACTLYVDSSWYSSPVSGRELFYEHLPLLYPEASSSSMVWDPARVPRDFSPRRTALVFMVLCFGTLWDYQQATEASAAMAERYVCLARAALNLESIFDKPPCICATQTMALLALYKSVSNDDDAGDARFIADGMAVKLAQSLGLHRDSARLRLSDMDTEKRRMTFWDLCFSDCMQSLASGRLPSFSLEFVDCDLPTDLAESAGYERSYLSNLRAWKAQFTRKCLLPVSHAILTAKAPKYSTVLDLDRQVQNIELPDYCSRPASPGYGFSVAMQHCMPKVYREYTLLHVHRTFFAQAICDHPADPMQSPYAPSFLAGYRSACNVLVGLRDIVDSYPAEVARFSDIWCQAFSSAVMLASIVTKAPKAKVSDVAFMELKQACATFERAAVYKQRADKYLPLLQRLSRKADQTLRSGTGWQQPDVDMINGPRADDLPEEDGDSKPFFGRRRAYADRSPPSDSGMKLSPPQRHEGFSRTQPSFGAGTPGYTNGHSPIARHGEREAYWKHSHGAAGSHYMDASSYPSPDSSDSRASSAVSRSGLSGLRSAPEGSNLQDTWNAFMLDIGVPFSDDGRHLHSGSPSSTTSRSAPSFAPTYGMARS